MIRLHWVGIDGSQWITWKMSTKKRLQGRNLVTEFQLFLARGNGEKPREHQKIQAYNIFFFQSNTLSVIAGFTLTNTNKSI